MSGAGGGGDFDLNKVFASHSVTIRKEDSPADAAWRRTKEQCLFFVFLVTAIIVFLVSGWVLLFSNEPADVKKAASGLIVAFASGGLGFLLGKKAD